MKNKLIKYAIIPLIAVFIIILVLTIAGTTAPAIVSAANKTTYTRQGNRVWLGKYPQTKATENELSKMSASPDENGYFTSGKDKFVKAESADPCEHSETANTKYLPFDDDTQPVSDATYYFKLEPIEWKVMEDDTKNDRVKLVSMKFLDTHAWFLNEDVQDNIYKSVEGIPANTPANSWEYSDMRAWLNDNFFNTAFSSDEKESICLFANKNTIDYQRVGNPIDDKVVIGNCADYDAAGDDGRPTDYAIVKGAKWCYNKDNVYYYVNAPYANFPKRYVRMYRNNEHEKVADGECDEAVRPILYAKFSDAKILKTATQKKERREKLLLAFGIIFAIVGVGMAVPIMVITNARYKKLSDEQKKGKFPYKKHEIPLLVTGILLVVGGFLMSYLPIALNGGGIGMAKLQPGIYLQDSPQTHQGNVAQVGKTAFRLNADGTFNYTDIYRSGSTNWNGSGTWSQSGSKVKIVWHGNPMIKEGTTGTYPIIDKGKAFGGAGERWKRIN